MAASRTAVADATVLIYLGKLDRLPWVQLRYRTVLVPSEVLREVRMGDGPSDVDAIRVARALDDGWMEVREVAPDPRVADIGLGSGDVAVLSLALAKGEPDVLSDDLEVRHLAEAHDLGVRGTLSFLLEGLRHGRCGFDAFLGDLERLQEVGFYISPALTTRAVRMARRITEEQ